MLVGNIIEYMPVYNIIEYSDNYSKDIRKFIVLLKS